jgi:hypothetical protein
LPPVSKNPVLQRQLKVGVLADYVLLEPGKQLKQALDPGPIQVWHLMLQVAHIIAPELSS